MEEDEPGGTLRASPPVVPPWESSGRDLTRVFALSDGIFAFAMTLLVLALALPAGFDPQKVGSVLFGLRNAFFAYVLSFLVIWLYWRSHRLIFAYIASYDGRLLNLNVGFLLFVAVMPFATNLLAAAGDQLVAVWTYALVQVAAGSLLTLVWVYAAHGHRHIDRSTPREWTMYITQRAILSPLVFAASLPIGLVSPSACEYAWAALFVLSVLRRRSDSARPAVPPAK